MSRSFGTSCIKVSQLGEIWSYKNGVFTVFTAKHIPYLKAVIDFYIFRNWEYVSIISGTRDNRHNFYFEPSGIYPSNKLKHIKFNSNLFVPSVIYHFLIF